MLANLDPAFRSRLEAINLVALFNSTLLTKYTLNDVLKPFVDGLKELNTVSYYIELILTYLSVVYCSLVDGQ